MKQDFKRQEFLNKKTSSTPFNLMVKPRGPICNLNCEYCYYLKKENLYPNSDFHMPDEVLESFTRQYIQSQRTSPITFAWQGGEPTLLSMDFFEKALAIQKKYAPPGIQIDNVLQTNGTLLDDEWCKFFKQNDFLIGISIDGPANIHNIYRKKKDGGPSFDQVITGLNLLIEITSVKHHLPIFFFIFNHLLYFILRAFFISL